MMKLCKDCRYMLSHVGPFPIHCEAPKANRSPIYGHSVEPCDAARMDDRRCGIDAKWFEPKPRTIWMRLFGG